MLKIQDLETMCPHCQGKGFIQDPQWVEWWAENSDVPPKGHPILNIREEVPCAGCGEIGYIPTEQGRVLLEFLNHFRGVKRI